MPPDLDDFCFGKCGWGRTKFLRYNSFWILWYLCGKNKSSMEIKFLGYITECLPATYIRDVACCLNKTTTKINKSTNELHMHSNHIYHSTTWKNRIFVICFGPIQKVFRTTYKAFFNDPRCLEREEQHAGHNLLMFRPGK